MELTDKALKAAVKKAVEVGLLPKAGFIDVTEVNWRKVKDVVEAALAASDDILTRLGALLRSETPTPPVPCGWARRFIRWTKGRPR
jgi:hypothetical protein